MATYQSRHGTLAISTVATVTMNFTQYGGGRSVRVVNRSGTGVIWYTIDGSTPVAAANDTLLVDANITANDHKLGPADGAETVTVKLISTAALDYSVFVY